MVETEDILEIENLAKLKPLPSKFPSNNVYKISVDKVNTVHTNMGCIGDNSSNRPVLDMDKLVNDFKKVNRSSKNKKVNFFGHPMFEAFVKNNYKSTDRVENKVALEPIKAKEECSKARKLKKIAKIGKGSYGSIYLVQDEKGKEFALKKYYYNKDVDMVVLIKNQIQILNELKHSCLPLMYETFTLKGSNYILQNYYPMSLDHLIAHNIQRRSSEPESQLVTSDFTLSAIPSKDHTRKERIESKEEDINQICSTMNTDLKLTEQSNTITNKNHSNSKHSKDSQLSQQSQHSHDTKNSHFSIPKDNRAEASSPSSSVSLCYKQINEEKIDEKSLFFKCLCFQMIDGLAYLHSNKILHRDLKPSKQINEEKIDEKSLFFKCLCFQMIDGLAYLHSNKILHRDLKPSNIMITENGEMKYIDFDLVRKIQSEDQPLSLNVGTLYYKPAELILGTDTYGFSLDLWSLGCILAEMYLGYPLFKAENEVGILNKITGVLGSINEVILPKITSLYSYLSFTGPEDILFDKLFKDCYDPFRTLIRNPKLLLCTPTSASLALKIFSLTNSLKTAMIHSEP
eukprot:CAMPEP_0170535644 /NCGR_PEP_ID=MMETSP0209-20121228/101713_1 /TAXON_ID=665100 ORGANISM="Litonotus pictus, Strain P1" /NCGR_SAMPLE_ID=MMETSP0209 /ASSEMBLY_ACC=CAM_ASM_000301 /LENGTH=570 /DNA_ID=CAMNT_0010836937 /DNA_START=362 /DNA_END=2074 /DNA_ORIENTATION=-